MKEEQNNVVKAFKSTKLNRNTKLNKPLRFITGNEDYNSKFLSNYNALVDFLWKKNIEGYFVKLEIGSGANRFYVY